MRGYILTLLFLSHSAVAMIFGDDSRIERYQITRPEALTYSKSTAALVLRNHLIENPDHTFSIHWSAPGVGRSKNNGVCPSAFVGQPELVSYCSSTLIGPDLLLTSGHCFYRGSSQTPEEVCAGSAAVFDYASDLPGKVREKFSSKQVFRCKKLELYAHDGDSDYALVRLDREVPGRKIYTLSNANQLTPLQTEYDYWTSGYPRGLPNKTILNARYFDFWGTSHLTALFQMDTEGGSSGSSVIDPVTQKIVGLIASSDCPDLEWSEDNKCFSEPHYSGQCRGVRIVLTDHLDLHSFNLIQQIKGNP